jgi:two-component system, OmpR family, sensor histidine kinase KdpD
MARLGRVTPPWIAGAGGYVAGLAGVGFITLLISALDSRVHIANISIIYLLLVLALAIWAGSGPAVVASIAAFFAYDWFFVPPVGRLTVADPSEWLALFIFLVVAIIAAQLADRLRRSAAEARSRARETAALYELSMEILGDARLEHVLNTIAERMIQILQLKSATIFLSNEDGQLRIATVAGESLDAGEERERTINVRWVMETGTGTNRFAVDGKARLTCPIDQPTPLTQGTATLVGTYLPVALGGQSLGLVAVTYRENKSQFDQETRHLLDAFVAQTALAVGRARLAAEEEKARAAAESERMQSVFLASVSHDLRTPLTSIKAAAESLREDAESRRDEPHRELAAAIDREATRLDRLVGNLLEISRIESGALPLRKSPEDLSELAGTVVGRITPMLSGRHLHVAIPDDLPLISLDPVEMDRVLTNLLENAIKFSPPDSDIELSAAVDDGFVELRVRNAGPPLSEEDRRRIFDKFYRQDIGANGPRGVGLGLAICKGIVEAHEGEIWAESANGGVSFMVRLPLTGSVDRVPVESGPR